MEKQRTTQIFAIVALIVAVVGLTVAFAAMSQRLTINGTATMETAEWDVRFQNLEVGTPVGHASITPPTLQQDDTYLGDFNIVLTRPGDSASFSFEVANNGTIDAQILGMKYNGILQSADTQEAIENSIYANVDWDGDGEVGEQDDDINKARENMLWIFGISEEFLATHPDLVLKAGESIDITFEVAYESSATELPAGDVELTFDSMEMLFEQAK